MADGPVLFKVAQGPDSTVAMTQSVYKTFSMVAAKARARIKRPMEKYAEEGPRHLNREQFRLEMRCPSGRGSEKVAVYCFKAWQVRVYGVRITMNEKPVFVCSEIDPSKKQDKANPKLIKQAAKKAIAFADET
jgi:hypothetical protein